MIRFIEWAQEFPARALIVFYVLLLGGSTVFCTQIKIVVVQSHTECRPWNIREQKVAIILMFCPINSYCLGNEKQVIFRGVICVVHLLRMRACL
jgi:hypothetical protein